MNNIRINKQWLFTLMLLLLNLSILRAQSEGPNTQTVVQTVRVGCYDFNGQSFLYQLERYSNLNCEICPCGTSWREAIEALGRGDIDLLVALHRPDEQLQEQQGLIPVGTHALLQSVRYDEQRTIPDGLLVRRGNEALLQTVYAAVGQMIVPTDSITFTAEEQDFIREYTEGGKKLLVALDNNWRPYSRREGDAYLGIVVDYWKRVMQQCSMNYEFYLPNRSVISEEVLNDEDVDLYLCYVKEEEESAREGLLTSAPFLHTGVALVTRREGPPLNVVAISLTTPVLNQHLNLPEETKVLIAPDCNEGVQMVLRGEADGIYLYSNEAQTVLNNDKTAQLILLPEPGLYISLRFVMKRDADHRLMSILSKCMRKVTEADIDAITAKHVSMSVGQYAFGDYIRDHWFVFALLVGFLLVVAIHLSVIYRNRARKLRDEARERMEKAYRTKIEDALAAAKQASMAKTAFLNNMSHDIRTPMNAVVGFTQLALSHLDNPERVEDYLHKIDRSSSHLLDLINNMLDMSRIESGRMCLNEQPMLLTEALADLNSLMTPAAVAKKITLNCERLGVHHREVLCDKLRLNQILVNLAGNAIKFTPKGGTIWICLVEVGEKRSGYVEYEFHVRDTGIGMSSEFIEKIFEPFSREHSSTVSKTEGSGLGMAITKSIVDLMGGTITVHSEPGQGSEFIVSLQLQLSTSSILAKDSSSSAPSDSLLTPEADADPDFTNKRLLLVEDNALNQEIATALLEELGFSIEVAENGQMAVDMISESEPGRYDAVLMDIQMPVMDGYEATRQIRLLSDPKRAQVPILAMTANAFEEDKARALAAGMNGHLSKPIDVPALIRMLSKVV